MGVIARAFRNAIPSVSLPPVAVARWQSGIAQLPNNSYRTFADEGYSRNELIYAAIEELSTSAAEPSMRVMQRNGEWSNQHPLLDIFNRPNPFMDSFELWSTVIMHTAIAGNAYGLLLTSQSGRPLGIWLLRPDRVRVVPDATKFISAYQYDIGELEPMTFPPDQIVHWKWGGKNGPLSDYLGQSPIMAAAGRVDTDNNSRDFVKRFFESAGVPAGLLSVKGKISPDARREIKDRFRGDYGGPAGWHELMVLDQDASFTPMTANLGASGLVVPELDEISEARILMVFGVPPELIGARVGMQNSSYAQKRSARESFWDETLAPMYKWLAAPVNMRLLPWFRDVERIAFDLSDVRALQPDEDQIQARIRANYLAGLAGRGESRAKIGLPAAIPHEDTFIVPANMAVKTPGTYDVPAPEPKPALPAPMEQG